MHGHDRDNRFLVGLDVGSTTVKAVVVDAKTDDILDPSKITVDSNRAVSIAQSQPILKGLTLRSSKLMLEKSDNQPVWKVELWAAKVSDHSKEASVGTVCISAIDGSVVKSDLHPSYAD